MCIRDRSMVYCGIYPAEGEKYENVKDALEKLQVNDAAFNFEPETSTALGFGFRCGFLGLLHMEIIVERLEREFNLAVITTSPSVIYRVVKTDGTVEMIQNPTNLPPVHEISYIEEPMVKADIMIPKAVSYTHLDVYKRQSILLIRLWEYRIVSRFAFRSGSFCSGSAVRLLRILVIS